MWTNGGWLALKSWFYGSARLTKPTCTMFIGNPVAKTLPFGKYKGYTIAEVAAGDPEYLQWLCSQDNFCSNRGVLYRDIIDCFEGLRDAPERKVMRGWFQDADFCCQFLQVSGGEALLLQELEARHAAALEQITGRIQDLTETIDKAKNYTGAPDQQIWAQEYGIFLDPTEREQQIADFGQTIATLHELHKKIANQIEAPHPKISCRFEQHGFDVVMRASLHYPWGSELRENYLGFQDDRIKRTVAIKIRGVISPTAVRWVRENRNRGSPDHVVLLVSQYDAQLVGELAATDIKIVFAADLV